MYIIWRHPCNRKSVCMSISISSHCVSHTTYVVYIGTITNLLTKYRRRTYLDMCWVYALGGSHDSPHAFGSQSRQSGQSPKLAGIWRVHGCSSPRLGLLIAIQGHQKRVPRWVHTARQCPLLGQRELNWGSQLGTCRGPISVCSNSTKKWLAGVNTKICNRECIVIEVCTISHNKNDQRQQKAIQTTTTSAAAVYRRCCRCRRRVVVFVVVPGAFF